MIIRRKLHETAANFERNLKEQLGGVETEIYADFFSILQELGNTQENMTQDISEKLRRERVELLRKVDKVSTYSSILVESLYRDLKKILIELGVWNKEDPIETRVLYSHQQELLEKHNSSSSSSLDDSRNKRHMLEWDFASYFNSTSESSQETYRSKRHMINWGFDSDTTQNLARYEPFGEEELQEILVSFDHMNSPAGLQDDPDTTLPDWTTAYSTGSPDSPHGETDISPRDCLDLLQSGMSHDGVYTIYPTGKKKATC